jgi:FMN-dependent NADH-azoreductase
MNTIRVIDSAITGDASKALVREAVAALTATHPTRVIHRDVGHEPIPHLTEATLVGARGETVTAAEHTTRALSDKLIAELREADTIVIGAPIYNFSVATGPRARRPRISEGSRCRCASSRPPLASP